MHRHYPLIQARYVAQPKSPDPLFFYENLLLIVYRSQSAALNNRTGLKSLAQLKVLSQFLRRTVLLLLVAMASVSASANAQALVDAAATSKPAVADLPAAEDDSGDKTVALAVDVSGAGALAGLLQDFLDINRHTADNNLSEREAQRLIGITPRQIKELLATAGYFTPIVTSTVERQPARMLARFVVDPGIPTTVEKVDIIFEGAITTGANGNSERIARIRREWNLRVGEVFRQDSWDNAKGVVLKDLLTRDYPAARIADSQAQIDPQSQHAQLTLKVDSGPAFTFGELQIQGLKRYPRSLVEPLNPIVPGEPYSQEKLNELQSQLQDSGYFRSVFATIEVDPANAQAVPVRIDLTENERKRLSLGVGFSTNSGARAQIKWLDRQFMGHDWRLDSDLKIDRLTKLLGADLAFPARDNGWRPSVGAHYERSDIVGETSDKINFGGRLASPDRVNEQVWGVSYLGDKERIADAVVNHRQALIASYVRTWRRLDNLLAPQRGTQTTLEIDAGPPGLINRKALLRATLHATWLAEPSPRWQTILRGQIGQIAGASRQTIPGDLLFRTGGDQTVRGYAYNSLGVAQDGAIVGGRLFALASAELVYRITPVWGAAVFHDAGNAADSWRDWRPVHGTGVGGRWRSPIGPVSLDLAYGHAVGKLRPHFSVGYAF